MRKGSMSKLINFLTPVLVVILLFFCASLLFPQLKKTERTRSELHKLEAEKSRMEAENAGLKEDVQNMNKKEFVIKAAREELNLVRPGEKIYKFE